MLNEKYMFKSLPVYDTEPQNLGPQVSGYLRNATYLAANDTVITLYGC
jgi:hypothetical protein